MWRDMEVVLLPSQAARVLEVSASALQRLWASGKGPRRVYGSGLEGVRVWDIVRYMGSDFDKTALDGVVTIPYHRFFQADDLVNKSQAAKILGISPRALRHLGHDVDIGPSKPSPHRGSRGEVYVRSDLDYYMNHSTIRRKATC